MEGERWWSDQSEDEGERHAKPNPAMLLSAIKTYRSGWTKPQRGRGNNHKGGFEVRQFPCSEVIIGEEEEEVLQLDWYWPLDQVMVKDAHFH
jgi:hypothetical protein